MAGEWIAYDLALPAKPEVQELIDETGEPVEVVVYRLLQLWGWASMHCSDGTARMTLPRLVRTCGADEDFWRAVAAVGWLEIDETAATVAVPGWDRRFSQAAKSRAQHQDRAAAQNDKDPDRKRRYRASCAAAQDAPAHERSRGDERKGEVPPPPREASQEQPAGQGGWKTLLEAWNSGSGRPWKPSGPPDHALERLAEPGWLQDALAAIEHLPRCRFFQTPVTLPQFVAKPGFARDLAGGKYDDVTPAKPRIGARPSDDRRSAAEAAADWQRAADDPEAARRRAEYLAMKASKTGGAA